MKNIIKKLIFLKTPLLCSILSACLLQASIACAKEPVNLALYKEELKQYHDSGKYLQEVDEAIRQGLAYLTHQVAQPSQKKRAIILDIDETSLSNYEDMVKLDFGGTNEQIQKAEDKGTDSPILSTLKLYRFAKANQIAVFFLTGRFERERAFTEANLKKAGFVKWDGLILRTHQYEKSKASEYKTAMRKKLTESGYDIILNIGDQQSDLAGGYAHKTIKLPNPYYFIP